MPGRFIVGLDGLRRLRIRMLLRSCNAVQRVVASRLRWESCKKRDLRGAKPLRGRRVSTYQSLRKASWSTNRANYGVL